MTFVIKPIVDVLLSDTQLAESWKRLGLAMSLTSVDLFQLESSCPTLFEKLVRIVELWMSKKGVSATIEELTIILRNEGFAMLADKIQEKHLPSLLTFFGLVGISESSPHFVGRSKEIKILQNNFETKSSFLTVIAGLGGIGKTELARSFVQTNKHHFPCIWLNGETTESIRSSIIQLADALKVQTSDTSRKTKETVDIFTEVAKWISDQYKITWILVIDNAENTNLILQPLLLRIKQNNQTMSYCFTLITSRNTAVVELGGNIISLDVLEEFEAEILVKDLLNVGASNSNTDPDIKELCRVLEYFPLTLQQASAYIKAEKLTGLKGESYRIADFLTIYEAQKAELLNFPLNKIDNDYQLTTLVTWDLTMKKIKNTNGTTGTIAFDLLNLSAYLNPDGISVDLLKRIYQTSYPNIEIGESLKLIKMYSLVKGENNIIMIHRLVQEVIRIKLSSLHVDVNELKVLQDLAKGFWVIKDQLKRAEMTHVLYMWKFLYQHDQLVNEFKELPDQIAHRLFYTSLYTDMLEFSQENYQKLKELLGPEDLQTMKMHHRIAWASVANGNYVEAVAIYAKVLDIEKRVLGEEHEETLTTAHNPAVAFQRLNQFEASLELDSKILATMRRVLGDDHKLTVITKQAIAFVLTKLKRYTEAMLLHDEILEWRLRNLGALDPDTLLTKHNIGWCLFEQGEFLKAKEAFESLLPSEMSVMGEEHEWTIQTKFRLVLSLAELGESGEVTLERLKEVLELQVKVLGEGHPNVALTRATISKVNEKMKWCSLT